MDIVSAQFVDNGSTLIASATMAEDIPARVSTGQLAYMFILDGGCGVGLIIDAAGRQPHRSGCGGAPWAVGTTVDGRTMEVPISKVLETEIGRAASWFLDVTWRGTDHRDQLRGREPVALDETVHDLSSPPRRAVTGNVFEVFHYPAITKDMGQVTSSIYRRYTDGRDHDSFAVPFTDFRSDDLFNTGPATGPINVPIQGIGAGEAHPPDGTSFGSSSLQTAVSPLFIGGPRFVESGVDDIWQRTPRQFHGHSYVMRWVAHEVIHRWAASLQFRDPETGRIERLTDDWCQCHWSNWLHAPARNPVSRWFSVRPYREASVMGGRVWRDNRDGTFTRRDTDFPLATGLSDLDLYVMGVIPPDDVRPTFLLRDVEETGSHRVVRARKVLVRIEDIVAAMGPRVPSARDEQKLYRLSIYLLHRGGAPRAEYMERAERIAINLRKYFTLAWGD